MQRLPGGAYLTAAAPLNNPTCRLACAPAPAPADLLRCAREERLWQHSHGLWMPSAGLHAGGWLQLGCLAADGCCCRPPSQPAACGRLLHFFDTHVNPCACPVWQATPALASCHAPPILNAPCCAVACRAALRCCRASAWCGTPRSRCWVERRSCACPPRQRRRWQVCLWFDCILSHCLRGTRRDSAALQFPFCPCWCPHIAVYPDLTLPPPPLQWCSPRASRRCTAAPTPPPPPCSSNTWPWAPPPLTSTCCRSWPCCCPCAACAAVSAGGHTHACRHAGIRLPVQSACGMQLRAQQSAVWGTTA